MTLSEGMILDDRYEVEGLIGQGGMSYVYRAKDQKMGRTVALKVLKEEYCEDEEFIKKFQNEAQAAAKLNHPNIVAAFDVVDDEERKLHYIVMELVEGITLKTYIQRKGRISSRDTIAIALQVINGMEQAHKMGIVHRDIKPQNIIVSKDGTIKVADFGIARAATQQTVNATVMGSVHYISPEQARSGISDERSDIYSFGCTMFEMLTGKVPYEGETSVAVVFAHLQNPIPHVRDIAPDVYPALDMAIYRCMEKKPGKRYQHIGELGRDLRRALKDPEGHFMLPPAEDEDASFEEEDDRRLLQDRMTIITRVITGVCIVGLVILIFFIARFALSFFRSGAKAKETTEVATTEAVTTSVNITISGVESMLPNIIGMTIPEAATYLKDYSIAIETEKSEYSDRYNEGMIISYPDGQYQSGDTIRVTVSKGSQTLTFYDPENPTDLTALHALNFRELEMELADRGVPYHATEEYSEDVPEGYIISTNKPDTSGSTLLEIVVSKGSMKGITIMPHLVGLTEEDALSTLAANELYPGVVSHQPNDAADGIVLQQGQPDGAELPTGTVINLVVSSGPDGEIYDEVLTDQTPVASAETTVEDTISEKSDSDHQDYWVSSLYTNVKLPGVSGPGETSRLIVSIRLRQDVDGEEHYTTLQDAKSYQPGTELPVVFSEIRGEYGIASGVVEVVDASTDTVLQSISVGFHPAG
jgi:serine/threonine-protein kinase